MQKKKVTVIGGGTGTVAVLTGLKRYEDLDLSVIVSMTDDGGSNKVVRDQFGLLPLSDLRKSIIALSGTGNGVLRSLFTYRFDKGDGLTGHTLGNLVMMALADIGGSELSAIEKASRIFNVKGKIIPVTLDDVRLAAKFTDGTVVRSEHLIDEPEKEAQKEHHIEKLYTEPVGHAYEEAVKAIEEADYIIAGPGDLYTSTLANIIIKGIPEAIKASKGKFVFVNNLMTKMGQTHGMTAKDLVKEMTKYAQRQPDYVLINSNIAYPEEVLEHYSQASEEPIRDDTNGEPYTVIKEDMILEEKIEKDQGDALVRSLIRHDSEKLADVLYNKVINS